MPSDPPRPAHRAGTAGQGDGSPVAELLTAAKRVWTRLQRSRALAASPLAGALPVSLNTALPEAPLDLDEPAEPLDLDHLSGGQALEPPLRLGLFGEFSAGKSSLANLLASSDLLPTSVLANTRRLTRLRFAPELQIVTIDQRGRRQAVELHEIAALAPDRIHEVEIGLPSERLRQFEVIDTPGFANPYHDSRPAFGAAEQVDAAIWCTRASQAWRHSEQHVWIRLPQRLRRTGVLVVTHGDALPRPEDRAQLAARLEEEAGAWFNSIVLLSIPAAAAHHAPGRPVDAAGWRASGGDALARALQRCLALALADRRGARRTGAPPAARPTAAAIEPAAVAVPDTAEPPAEAPPSDLDGLLWRVADSMPDCLLAACIDLKDGRPVATRARVPPPPAIAAAIAGLTARLQAAGPGAPLQEIALATGQARYVLLRRRQPSDQALLVITGAAISSGEVLARARVALMQA